MDIKSWPSTNKRSSEQKIEMFKNYSSNQKFFAQSNLFLEQNLNTAIENSTYTL